MKIRNSIILCSRRFKLVKDFRGWCGGKKSRNEREWRSIGCVQLFGKGLYRRAARSLGEGRGQRVVNKAALRALFRCFGDRSDWVGIKLRYEKRFGSAVEPSK